LSEEKRRGYLKVVDRGGEKKSVPWPGFEPGSLPRKGSMIVCPQLLGPDYTTRAF